jgi:tRNA dimethylallyltransferase
VNPVTDHAELVARCRFLAGPTASGKSAVALELAERLGGEIITADSMQVYRGLDLGTAKPTPEEQARIPHHLLDVCDLPEAFDAAQFRQRATVAAADILARGRVPIFCGGTGLYLKAFIEGLGEAPPSDTALRAELEALPLETLLAELAERDPACFAVIDRQNPRRVVRAVEVIRLTGRPFSAQRAAWPTDQAGHRAVPYVCLHRSSADLQARIAARVDIMFAQGLVAETERLLAAGLEHNRTALQAIGYRQVVGHLRGEHDLATTVELVKIRTRQFAKRQLTWFRTHSRAKWLSVPPDESPATTAAQVLQAWS